MTLRNRFRALSAIPFLFAIFGALIAAASVATRKLWSPVPGIGVGLVVVVASVIACVALWRRSHRAAVAVLMSGAATLGALLLLWYLFPIVTASSEPPSFLERIWYPTARALIILLSGGAAWATRTTHRERAPL